MPSKPSVEWPSDIETLKAMIASGAALPGNGFSTSSVAPVGPAKCDVMVISDLPDQDEVAGKTLGSGATGVLLGRMLAAIGINLTDCYWTALATLYHRRVKYRKMRSMNSQTLPGIRSAL